MAKPLVLLGAGACLLVAGVSIGLHNGSNSSSKSEPTSTPSASIVTVTPAPTVKTKTKTVKVSVVKPLPTSCKFVVEDAQELLDSQIRITQLVDQLNFLLKQDTPLTVKQQGQRNKLVDQIETITVMSMDRMPSLKVQHSKCAKAMK